MAILEHENYRTYLKSVMAEKAARNPRFSLRSMAKVFGIAPSFLSTVLKGDKNLSFEMATTIAKKIGLTGAEADYFCLLVQKEAAKDPETRESLVERLRRANPRSQINDLTTEQFKIISDPLHFSILSATTLTGFVANARNLSFALHQSQAEIEMALDRLQKLEMIEKVDGVYVKVKANPRVVSLAPNQALRKFHQATLGKAVESLETQTPQEKVIGSETFTVGLDQVEAFRQLTDEFFDRAIALSKRAKSKDYVYHLGVQFFNLTPNLKPSPKRKKQ